MPRTIVITGANRGIGLELTKKYLAQGDRVYSLCRHVSDELKQTNAKIIKGVDVSNLESLKNTREQIDEKIDILINNAGIMSNEVVDELNESAFNSMLKQFEVNSLGPLKCWSVMNDKLSAGAKVAMITSRMGSIADNTSGGRYGYRASKTALNSLSVSLAQDLKGREISVGIFHPGWVQTDMTNKTGHLTPAESAANLYQRIEELNLEKSGKFFHSNGESLPW